MLIFLQKFILSLALLNLCSPLLAQQKKSLKEKILEIRKAAINYKDGSSSSLRRNPLEGDHHFFNYTSQAYLYFYQGIGYFISSQDRSHKKNKALQKQLLEKALRSFNQMERKFFLPGEDLSYWKFATLKARLKLSNLKQEPSLVLKLAKDALLIEPEKKDLTEYQLAAFYYLGQLDRARNLLKIKRNKIDPKTNFLAPLRGKIKIDLKILAIEEKKGGKISVEYMKQNDF